MVALGDIVSAYKAKRTLTEIKRAKINVERERIGLPPIRSWSENMWLACCMSARAVVLRTCCGCFLEDERGRSPGILSPGTLPNEVLKCVVGFVCGVVISILMFLLLVYQLQFSPGASFIGSAIISSTLSIGLAFSIQVRCIVMVAMPTLFSSKGRAVLLMYAFVLIMTYPMDNFQHNTEVLSQSALCGQEAVYNATKEVIDVALAPVRSIIGRIRKLIKSLMHFTSVLKQGFLRVQRVFEEVLAAVSRVKTWLLSFVSKCNHNMGTPYRKCRGAITDAVERCKRRAWIFKFACNIAKVYWVCHIARVGELLCIVTDAIVKIFIDQIKPKMQLALRNVAKLFDFGVDLDYHYSLQLNQSKSYEEIREGTKTEVREKLAFIETVKAWSNLLLLWTLSYVLLRATLYRLKYLTRDYYDNVYITETVELIDERRQELGKETILPLTWSESRKYVFVWSAQLSRSERTYLILSLSIFWFSAMHAGFYMALDHGLFILLQLVRDNGQAQTNNRLPNRVSMNIKGKGLMADIYRTLVTQFDPNSGDSFAVAAVDCLPNPRLPDYYIYKVIGSIFLTSLFTLFFEAYTLRLRQVVCGIYHPERERERAVWLYNHILKTRGGFLSYIRRRMRVQYDDQKAAEKISIRARLGASCPLFERVMEMLGFGQVYCLSCGHAGSQRNVDTEFARCASYGCEAIYCNECFKDLNNICSVCQKPLDYEGASEISEEEDSSGPEEEEQFRKTRDDIEAAREAVHKEFPFLDFSYQNRYLDADSNTDTASSTTSSYTSSSDGEEEEGEEEEEEEEEEEDFTRKYRHHRRRHKNLSKPDLVPLDIFDRPDGQATRRAFDPNQGVDETWRGTHRPGGLQRAAADTVHVDIPEKDPRVQDTTPLLGYSWARQLQRRGMRYRGGETTSYGDPRDGYPQPYG